MSRSDKKIKERLRMLLSEAFGVSIDAVAAEKTTDLVVKCGKDETDWYFFEIKTTDITERKNKDKYFGAISLNQLVEAEIHPEKYYFILVSTGCQQDKYTIIKPKTLLSYLTGYYLHADFSIPDSILQKQGVDFELFKDTCKELCDGMYKDLFPEKKAIKQGIDEKIQKLQGLVKRQTSGSI